MGKVTHQIASRYYCAGSYQDWAGRPKKNFASVGLPPIGLHAPLAHQSEVAHPPVAARGAEAAGGLPSGALAGLDEDTPNVEFLLDIKLHVTFEVGRAKMLISDLLTLGQGSVVELHRLVGEELDVLVNSKLVAKGEVVVVNEKFGCRVTEIVSPEDRIKHLAGYGP